MARIIKQQITVRDIGAVYGTPKFDKLAEKHRAAMRNYRQFTKPVAVYGLTDAGKALVASITIRRR